MKKILRSLMWRETAEQASAKGNYERVLKDRLLNLGIAEKEVLDFCLEFLQTNGEAPQFAIVADYFESSQQLAVLTCLEDVVEETFYESASFEALWEQEVEKQATEHLVNTCRTAVKVAVTGADIEGKKVKGVNEAATYILTEARGKPEDPKGRMPSSLRESASQLTDLYKRRKNNPSQTYGIPTGYGLYDASTAGIRKKQLYLHAGFGGHLKSTHMMNMMVNAAVDGGWNPVLFTSEMPADDVKQMLIAIHSGNPIFTGVGMPLSAFRLLLGGLSAEEETFYEKVKEDLTTNSDYGDIRIIDSSRFDTLGSVFQITQQEHQREEVDQLWIDYITRLKPDPKYRKFDMTTAKNEMIADCKRYAMQFDQEGLAVCSPFQVNREGYKHAKANEGRMSLTALAQFNAAEREADVVTYIYYDDEEQLLSEPKIGILKSRWGPTKSDPMNVYIDPDCRRIVDLSAGMPVQGSTAPTAGGMEEDIVV